MELDTSDVIRLILQFLREHRLEASVAALQAESDVPYNVVEDVGGLTAEVMAGRWAVVLPRLAALALPPAVLADVYEQVVRELAEAREGDVARSLLRGTMPLQLLQQEDPPRFARLEALAASVSASRAPEAAVCYPDGRSREARRAACARAIGEHLVVVPPSRLTTLLGQAMQWQHAAGSLQLPPGGGAAPRFDVFRGMLPPAVAVTHTQAAVAPMLASEERPPTVAGAVIRGGATPQCAAFTPDGSLLVIGSDDGIIEVYDGVSGKLRTDLAYQAKDEFMMHDKVGAGVGLRGAHLQESGVVQSGRNGC